MRTDMPTTLVLATLALAASVAACDAVGDPPGDIDVPAEDAPEAAPAEAPPTGETPLSTSLRIDSLAGVGSYVTDAYGRAVYLFTADSAGTSACYGPCAERWPPYIAPEGEVTVDAPELDASRIGSVQRENGANQVTYGGHPLYYFVGDVPDGKATGQDVLEYGGEWYLVAPDGDVLEAHEEEEHGDESGGGA